MKSFVDLEVPCSRQGGGTARVDPRPREAFHFQQIRMDSQFPHAPPVSRLAMYERLRDTVAQPPTVAAGYPVET
jgi:hypothetical protein